MSSGNDSFFATAYDVGLARFRYDPGCMLPADARARKAAQFFETVMSDATDHHWSEPGLVLLIDNRRVLHARASADHEPQREIQRLSFFLNREVS
ncbi:TauD/TfdA family dioxygenase [Streptomyces gobiensis]|uniref:TauD/TfdA family dioxygenase n=1 Tax=Streptomyces gobiensis TaxID=2875706 RepID=UPI001E509484|nr:TauD/TfdA family dioxygenase [Streptomyces gobiensis]UGY93916.1 TauD/TfdA family dioxygenase [Streptomyces gobiensis]